MWPADRDRARVGALDQRGDALGLLGAAQRDDDVHPRARRRAALVARRSPPTSSAMTRSGTNRAGASAPAGRICAGAFRSPTASTRRSRSASSTYGVEPDGRCRRYLRERCSRIRCCANGRRRRWRKPTIVDADEPRVIYRDKIAAARTAQPMPDVALAACAGRAFAPPQRDARGRCASAAAARRTSTASARRRDARRARLRGIVDYEPTELVITARAGTPLAEVEDALRRARADAGVRAAALRRRARRSAAIVATGLSGPRRPYAGAVRDSCSACASLDGTGDDSRLRRPRDEERRRLRRRAADDRRARHARRAHRNLAQVPAAAPKVEIDARARVQRPTMRSRSSTSGAASRCRCRRRAFTPGRLRMRLSGAPAAVASARRASSAATSMPTRGAFWRGLRDQTHATTSHLRCAAMRRCGACRCARRRRGPNSAASS